MKAASLSLWYKIPHFPVNNFTDYPGDNFVQFYACQSGGSPSQILHNTLLPEYNTFKFLKKLLLLRWYFYVTAC